MSAPSELGPLWRSKAGWRLRVRVQPGARRESLGPAAVGAEGLHHLKVSVRAAPTDGEANEAVIALLANALGTPKSAIALVSGAGQRLKIVALPADPPRIDDWRRRLGLSDADGDHP